MASVVNIDGSMLEGGGQILRYSAALSALTGASVGVQHIRAKRAKPGLQPQHLTGLKLVEAISGGQLEGGAVGSSSIVLRPGAPSCGRYAADTRTAGSCTLMVQAAMPVCVFARPRSDAPSEDSGSSAVSTSGRPFSELTLRGGTDADLAPPASYLADVLAPLLRRLYGDLMEGLEVDTVRRGFYPKGGGVLTVRVPSLPPGTPLPPIDLTKRGNITQVTVRAFSAGRLPATVAKRLAASAEAAVRRALKSMGPAGRGVPVLVEATLEPPERAFGDGCGVMVFADTDTGCRLGASAKGERGVPAEQIGERAAAELEEALDSGTCVDQWMQDQLIIWMAVGSGVSRVVCAEPTLHTRTAMVVCEALLPGVKFTLHRPPKGAARLAAAPAAAAVVAAADSANGHEEGDVVTAGEHGEEASGGRGGGGLWLIECKGAGWTAGRMLDPTAAQ